MGRESQATWPSQGGMKQQKTSSPSCWEALGPLPRAPAEPQR